MKPAKQHPLLSPEQIQVGHRVCMRTQHAMMPDGFTTYTDHEVMRVWLWASGLLRGISLRPFRQDGPQVFVPIHHIVRIEQIEAPHGDKRPR